MNKKLHQVAFVLLLGLYSAAVCAQNTWTKTIGTPKEDQAYYARQTFDGGYIITGYSVPENAFNSKLWLIRTNSNGDTLWTKSYGGINNDEGNDVQQTTDNGFIVTGITSSFGSGNFDMWLLKTDSNGDTLWTSTYGGANNDFGNSVFQTDDGGYFVIGSTESAGSGASDFWVVKTNAAGELLWEETYGGTFNDIAFEGQPTSDGGFILAGYTQQQGFSNADVWLVKLLNTGDIEWEQTYGGSFDELAYSVSETADAGYILSGYTYSFGSGMQDLWLIKTDMYGDTLWTKTVGGSSNDAGHCVIETDEGDFLVSGSTFSYSVNGDMDLWLVKTDISGNTLWTNTYGGPSSEVGYSVNETFDGNLIVSGFTSSYGAGNKDVWLLHLDFEGQTGLVEQHLSTQPTCKLEQNFPNPFSHETTIHYSIPEAGITSLNVYDLTGKKAATLVHEFKRAGNHSLVFTPGDLKDGIYYYQLQSGKTKTLKKCILLR